MKMAEPIIKSYTSPVLNAPIYKYFNNVISTNVTETEYTEWVAGTSYQVGDRVIHSPLHRVFEAKVNIPASSGTLENWIDVGSTNAYNMFNFNVSTSTTQSADIALVLGTSFVSLVTFQNLQNVSKIEWVHKDSLGNILKSGTIIIKDYGVSSFYEYLFKPISFLKKEALTLKTRINSTLELLFVRADNTLPLEIGAVAMGLEIDLGCTLRDTSLEFTNLSKFEADYYGITADFKNLGTINRLKASMIIEKSNLPTLYNKLEETSGNLNIYIIDEVTEYRSLANILGYHRTIAVSLDGHTRTAQKIEIIERKGA